MTRVDATPVGVSGDILAEAVAALLFVADQHKRSASFHRRRCIDAHNAIERLRRRAADAGIHLTIKGEASEDDTHGPNHRRRSSDFAVARQNT